MIKMWLIGLLISLGILTNGHGYSRFPRPIPSSRPTHTPRPTKVPKRTPTPTPTLAPTPTPTPSVIPSPVIERVEVYDGTSGESVFGWLTGVKVIGKNFMPDSRVKLVKDGVQYLGSYQGSEPTWILTDFTALPHCAAYDAVVYGSTGTATVTGAVNTVCP